MSLAEALLDDQGHILHATAIIKNLHLWIRIAHTKTFSANAIRLRCQRCSLMALMSRGP